ncbi:hypothetical protein H2203_005197 [Taxawa tesnikishii (nom. ined.)]|nr:hypothetical protein H2203_005197 [Dothideales sp. JES 119]
MRKLRAIINKTVDRKTKKVIKRLGDDLQKSRAEATLERLSKQQVMEALRHEKKKRKRGKKLIEQFRADEGSGAILFSPSKVRAALKLQDQREQEKEQERENREQRAQERAVDKVRKEQEAQKRRDDRAVAQAARKASKASEKAQREAERVARKAQRQAKLKVKAQKKRPRGRPRKQQVPTKPVVTEEPPSAPKAPKQLKSRIQSEAQNSTVAAAVSAHLPTYKKARSSTPVSSTSPVSIYKTSLPSPPNPVFSYYDPAFGRKVREEYDRSQFIHFLREGKYGTEIAQRYKRGFTPEELRQEYEDRIEQLRREDEETVTSDDELPPDQRPAVIARLANRGKERESERRVPAVLPKRGHYSQEEKAGDQTVSPYDAQAFNSKANERSFSIMNPRATANTNSQADITPPGSQQ